MRLGRTTCNGNDGISSTHALYTIIGYPFVQCRPAYCGVPEGDAVAGADIRIAEIEPWLHLNDFDISPGGVIAELAEVESSLDAGTVVIDGHQMHMRDTLAVVHVGAGLELVPHRIPVGCVPDPVMPRTVRGVVPEIPDMGCGGFSSRKKMDIRIFADWCILPYFRKI